MTTLYQEDPHFSYLRLRFVAESGFVSSAIRLISRSPAATHVELITPQNTTIGARSDGGIQERPLDYCRPIWERRYSLAVPQSGQVAALIADARRRIGTKYDFTDILGLVLQDGLHDPDKAICSEFVFDLTSRYLPSPMLNVLNDRGYLVTPEMLHLSPYLIGRCTYSQIS